VVQNILKLEDEKREEDATMLAEQVYDLAILSSVPLTKSGWRLSSAAATRFWRSSAG